MAVENHPHVDWFLIILGSIFPADMKDELWHKESMSFTVQPKQEEILFAVDALAR